MTGLRADARRNREKILAAARDLFREQGTAVALDDIARRAEVGIGTLYRRFPDRDALITDVALEGFETGLAAVEAARAAGGGTVEVLAEMFRRVVAQRDRLVMPLIGGPVVRDPRVRELQRAILDALEEVLAEGRAEGVLRTDVTAFDLIGAAAMACRPMPHLPSGVAAALAARHVAVYLHGLRPEGALALPAMVEVGEHLGLA
ncbi:TetR/AcrR family transcriptional regulator [Streptomyces sp. ASQP_92]|uniref:TetR/AcrR family transcriptional regulator n=1 Tax=Streptomyces sp. ASQP_92 TaxID=2979116 RepID=UPI0021BE783E|nr:TetR/AcrR family transcriptional regulator [Streptomyces sp. ASQP_92]MCT9092994.1 TetR/AcrR family transcriptional regulator [Streptomyces sp. ASQP_92]